MGTDEAANLLGTTVKALQWWQREGQLDPAAHNRRRDTESLLRFGYDRFAHHAALHGCELLVLNQERLSPEQEVVQNLMTIVHCASSRLHDLRSYRRQLSAALESIHVAGTPDQD